MPRKTAEAIREYNQEYYKKNREKLLSILNDRYHTDDDFFERHQAASAKWYKERNIGKKRLIQRNKNNGIIIMPETEPTVKKPPKKPKSSLQLKRERIAKNLKIVEEKARIFREKLNSQNSIYNAPQIENEPATDNSRSD